MAMAVLPNNPMNFCENQQGNIVLENLRAQKEQGRFCDVTLYVQGKQFRAHRNVLASCSPYFDSILKMHRVVKERLTVTCQDSAVFLCLLNYMYTGSVVIDKNNVSELLRLSNHFLVSKLKKYCAEYLDQNLDVTNCLSVKDMAEKYNMPALSTRASSFIQMHVEEILQQEEILSYPYSKVEEILGDKTLAIPPNSLLAFISAWVWQDVMERECHIRSLLGFVEWHHTDQSTIVEHLSREPLYTASPISLYYFLKSLYENGLSLPQEYSTTYQELFTKYGKQDVEVSDGDSFLSVAVSSAMDSLQNAAGNDSGNKESKSNAYMSPSMDVSSIISDVAKTLNPNSVSSEISSSMTNCPSNSNSTSGALDAQEKVSLNGCLQNYPCEGDGTRGKCSGLSENDDSGFKRKHPGSDSFKSSTNSHVGNGKIDQKNNKTTTNPVRTRFKDGILQEEEEEEDFDDDDEDDDDDMMSEEDYELEESLGEDLDAKKRKVWGDRVKCQICGHVARDARRLERHTTLAHSRAVTYKCGMCGFTCRWNKEYFAHVRGHFRGPPYQCDSCDFTCDRIHLILAHRVRHVEEKPFHCTECGIRCRSRASLTAHMRSHTKELPVPAEYKSSCLQPRLPAILLGEKFDPWCPPPKELSVPKQIVPAEVPEETKPNGSAVLRPHVCAVCGRGFHDKSHLVRHERIHLGEKPFRCDQCEYASSRRDKLKEHQRRHHKKNAAEQALSEKGNFRSNQPESRPSTVNSYEALDMASAVNQDQLDAMAMHGHPSQQQTNPSQPPYHTTPVTQPSSHYAQATLSSNPHQAHHNTPHHHATQQQQPTPQQPPPAPHASVAHGEHRVSSSLRAPSAPIPPPQPPSIQQQHFYPPHYNPAQYANTALPHPENQNLAHKHHPQSSATQHHSSPRVHRSQQQPVPPQAISSSHHHQHHHHPPPPLPPPPPGPPVMLDPRFGGVPFGAGHPGALDSTSHRGFPTVSIGHQHNAVHGHQPQGMGQHTLGDYVGLQACMSLF
ncbi:hypermethylated in cancer 2 protein-like isoform X2 [Ischnura elegans]|uniref:hypermethylated in cancer 2 protein-like isoform X2 n=1 Tax=Ischnura elegans TaxID=197161 RepID=UPI001ED8A354|nr:hypermethylated in cancer 2 protein-like isoform X2 [Ischnura elegans]